jgi:hypothetical protein
MIIGVVGFIGSGKGTVADILVNKKDFTKISFADSVKDATAAIFGWPRSLLEGDTDESREFRETKDEWWSEKTGKYITPRNMLQLIGTEAGRDVIHPDVWVLSVERKIGMYKNVVIPDVRFPNEMNFIQKMGGFVVRVRRGDDPEWYETARRANLESNTDLMCDYPVHYSEWAWIGHGTDYQLDNVGAISMLESDIEHMIRVFTGPKNPAILAA